MKPRLQRDDHPPAHYLTTERSFSLLNASYVLHAAAGGAAIAGKLVFGYLMDDNTGTYVTAFQVWAGAFLLAGLATLLIRLPNREDAVH